MKTASRLCLVCFAPLLLCAPGLAAQDEPPATKVAAEGERTERKTVTIPAGTHLPLVLQNSVNTKTAQPGDSLYFETVYPVVVENRILVPAGSFVRGTLTQVRRPGRVKGRGELHVRFDELTLPNGYTVKLAASLAAADTGQGEEVQREEGVVKGESSKGEDITTVATTTGAGTGVGAIATGSRQGAAIGAGAGAAAGLATVLLTRGKELQLPRGTSVEIIFSRALELDAGVANFDWTGQPSALPAPASPDQRRTNQYPRRPF